MSSVIRLGKSRLLGGDSPLNPYRWAYLRKIARL